MQKLRKYLGIVWMLSGPAAIFFIFSTAIKNISTGGLSDINKPLPWIIIIVIFTPIAVGLSVFGWYAWNKEFADTTIAEEE